MERGMEMNPGRSAVRERAIALMKSALAEASRRGDVVVPRAEAQVHEAVDLLRMSQADRDLLATAESVSCVMMEMSHYRRQGRINAYASKLIRVRKACEALA
jgi:hypothetical protein